MASPGGLFGEGSLAAQFLLWGVAYGVAQAMLSPELDDVRQAMNQALPILALSPADLADLVVRGGAPEDAAAVEAAKSGISADRFANLVHLAGEPPGLDFVLQAWRRGFVGFDDTGQDTPSVDRAIKTSRVYDYWSDVVRQMADIPISIGEAVDAALRGQIPLDQAAAEANASGINADRFKILLDTAGNPPSLSELLELLRRGLIQKSGVGPEEITFQQGIFEGDTKNKWWQQFAALAVYLPPPRTVTALLRAGSITTQRAQELWQDAGLAADLAAAYAKNATAEKLAGTRQLAETAVLTLYESQAIDAPTATAHLSKLGYSPADVAFLLEMADLQREVRAVNSAVSRIGTLYTSHKINRGYARDALVTLDVTGPHADHLLATWDIEVASNVRQLTPAQIVDAWQLGIIDQAEAEAELRAVGYTPRDAWILISIKAKAAQPNPPAQGPALPGEIP